MSAWAGEPDHFARALRGEGGDRRGFAERRLFGRYLGEILDEAVAERQIDVGQSTRPRAARRAATAAGRSSSMTASAIDADGAGACRRQPGARGAERLRRRRRPLHPQSVGRGCPGRGQRARRRPAATALLVGTGLTMVDLVLSLDAAGHRGRIVALSRRGLIPASHADFEPAPVERDELPHGELCAHCGAGCGGAAPRSAGAPRSTACGRTASACGRASMREQQRRFLRHARPWWDVHRHRIAPEVARHACADGRATGGSRSSPGASSPRATASDGARGRISPARREHVRVAGRFAYAFNCTGPLHSIARTQDPLLRSLLDGGQVRRRPTRHRARGRRQVARRRNDLWALGPLTKGRYWEIIAVPDIREQAAAVAEDIELELGR